MDKDKLRNIKKGYYWAKSENYKWWNLIIHVDGDEPFLRIAAWDLSNNKTTHDLSCYDITKLGPQIEDANQRYSGENK